MKKEEIKIDSCRIFSYLIFTLFARNTYYVCIKIANVTRENELILKKENRLKRSFQLHMNLTMLVGIISDQCMV